MAVTSRTRVRMPRAERREQILAAAAGAFVQGGFDGTSMDDVARAAGVTRLIVYRIFESKEALYLAVLHDVIADVGARFDRHDLRASIARLLLGAARRRPDGFRLLWRHAAHEPEFRVLSAQFRSAVLAYAVDLLAEEMPDEMLRQWAAASLASHLYESVCLWLDQGTPERDEEFVELLSQGVRAMVNRWVAPARATSR